MTVTEIKSLETATPTSQPSSPSKSHHIPPKSSRSYPDEDDHGSSREPSFSPPFESPPRAPLSSSSSGIPRSLDPSQQFEDNSDDEVESRRPPVTSSSSTSSAHSVTFSSKLHPPPAAQPNLPPSYPPPPPSSAGSSLAPASIPPGLQNPASFGYPGYPVTYRPPSVSLSAAPLPMSSMPLGVPLGMSLGAHSHPMAAVPVPAPKMDTFSYGDSDDEDEGRPQSSAAEPPKQGLMATITQQPPMATDPRILAQNIIQVLLLFLSFFFSFLLTFGLSSLGLSGPGDPPLGP